MTREAFSRGDSQYGQEILYCFWFQYVYSFLSTLHLYYDGDCVYQLCVPGEKILLLSSPYYSAVPPSQRGFSGHQIPLGSTPGVGMKSGHFQNIKRLPWVVTPVLIPLHCTSTPTPSQRSGKYIFHKYVKDCWWHWVILCDPLGLTKGNWFPIMTYYYPSNTASAVLWSYTPIHRIPW